MQNKAVVVGGLGVIGRYIVERLIEKPDWQVVGLSRRKTSDRPRYRHIAIDLLDAEDTESKLAELRDVTHVFYAAFQAAAGNASNFASNTGPNRAMLVNSVTAIDRAAPHLKRVVLVTGTKYYGVHLGPLKTPMRETDPRHVPPNYYFDQIDWLTAYQRGKKWDWVELRPQTLCGFAPGSPMSILPAIAVYAAISKELGLPLRFPGKPSAYDTVYQVTESTHFANAALWAATHPRCGNQAFNITNGDYFRTFGQRSQRCSKCQLQIRKQFLSRSPWPIKARSGRKLPPNINSSAFPTRIWSLGHLRIMSLALTGT